MVQLAFFLDRPHTLLEIIETGPHEEDAFYALLELGYINLVKENPRLAEFPDILAALKGKLGASQSPALQAYLIQNSIDQGKFQEILPYTASNEWKIWAYLLLEKWEEAGALLEKQTFDQLSSERSPLFPLFGCYLWATQGENTAKTHFNTALDTPYPRTASLLSHFLSGKINLKTGWIETALIWEKMELFRQLILLSHCSKNPEAAQLYAKKLKKLVTRGKRSE